MSAKKSKLLRKQLNYHPNTPRNYEMIKGEKRVENPAGGMITVPWKGPRQELSSADPRYMYQQLKKS